jgi:hypothetical protein
LKSFGFPSHLFDAIRQHAHFIRTATELARQPLGAVTLKSGGGIRDQFRACSESVSDDIPLVIGQAHHAAGGHQFSLSWRRLVWHPMATAVASTVGIAFWVFAGPLALANGFHFALETGHAPSGSSGLRWIRRRYRTFQSQVV